MLRIIHTADWHLGQSFFGYERKKEHQIFLEWLQQTLIEKAIHVLMIAGDIFDSPNPSAESQRVFYQFLKKITTDLPNLQIIVIAGNHDSAARIEATNPILEEMNIRIIGTVTRDFKGEILYDKFLIPIKKDNKTIAWCIAVPYLRQGDYPPSASYIEGIETMYNVLYNHLKIKIKEDLPIIVMGHLHVSGAALSVDDRSERIVVGGIESLSPSIFEKEDIVYTALGHLHRSQCVGENDRIRYSGSPLPMSFTEKDYEQGVNLIQIKDVEQVSIDRIKFVPPVSLMSIPQEPAPLNLVLDELKNLQDGEVNNLSPFLEVKVLLTEPEPGMRYSIEKALENKAVRFVAAPVFKLQAESPSKLTNYDTLKAIQPIDMAEDIFMKHYGDQMPPKMKSLLVNLIRNIAE